MAVTGHKSVQALSMYQRVDDGDKIRMGKTLTDNVLKEPYKTMAAISYTTTSMGQGRPGIAGGNNSLALPSTERSNISIYYWKTRRVFTMPAIPPSNVALQWTNAKTFEYS